MHVVMLSTDQTVFDPASPARVRMEEYARAFGTLSVIVLCLRALERVGEVGEALFIYPTNSFSRVFSLRDAVRIAEHMEKADVVTAQDPFETGLAGYWISQSLGIPLHVQVHTNFLASGFSREHWPLNTIRAMIAGFVLPRAARIRAVSGTIKKAIETRYRPKAAISVLPIFVDIEKFRRVIKTDHPRFGTALLVVSRLEPEKRVERAIEALKKARDAGFDAGLTIVGSGREEKRLKREAERLGVSKFIEFAGFQNNLAPYYAVADALLYPGASYEGFGMGILEALAAGVPVLAGDVGIARQAGAEIAEGDCGDALVRFLKKNYPEGRLLPSEERGKKVRLLSRTSDGRNSASLLLYEPYASKEEYLKKLSEDLRLSYAKLPV